MAKTIESPQQRADSSAAQHPAIVPEAVRRESAIEIAVRNQLEDKTERFLYARYDEAAPALAEQFRKLVTQTAHETAVLAELARSLDFEVTPEQLSEPDPDVDRIVWRQAARSSTIALLDWLLSESRRSNIAWQDWASWCASGHDGIGADYAEFRAETALGPDDAKLALAVVARTIVESPSLQLPVSLFYKGRNASLRADKALGTIGSVRTASLPLAWLDLTREVEETDHDDQIRLSVLLKRGAGINVIKLAPAVDITQVRSCLVVAPKIGARVPEKDVPRVELSIDQRTRVEQTSDGVRLRMTRPGKLNLCGSRGALVKFGGGYLLEWNVFEDVVKGAGGKG